MSHLFTDKEIREGWVEPGENSKKAALDPEKINLIKSEFSKCSTI